jgi:hypothetical protein
MFFLVGLGVIGFRRREQLNAHTGSIVGSRALDFEHTPRMSLPCSRFIVNIALRISGLEVSIAETHKYGRVQLRVRKGIPRSGGAGR